MSRSLHIAGGFFLLAALAVPGTPGARAADSAATVASAVREEFLHAWRGYRALAWGHDELRPVSGTARDWYATPFDMTAVDALDTMILMGLRAEADSTREYIAAHLSFDRDVEVKNFEFTIRFLGGLLSSYQLTGDRRLLALATDLGRRLMPAFRSPTGLPYVMVNLRTGAVRGNVTNPAEAGTLLIEFGTLARLTGDARFYGAAKRSLSEVFRRRSPLGLVGSAIDVESGAWVETDSHVSGGIDSYYEYLVKCWRLFGDEDCLRMWQASVPALNRWLADTAGGGLWYGHADMATGKRTQTLYGALDAFFPAVLCLSGDISRAAHLESSCFRMWTRYGVEPELIDYRTMTAVDSAYDLRPEIIESAYYLYHYTHDIRYRRMGETMFGALRRYCRTPHGYAALANVRTKLRADAMESYALAETFKYLYLLFAPAETLDFDAVTFNTEAHPLRRTW